MFVNSGVVCHEPAFSSSTDHAAKIMNLLKKNKKNGRKMQNWLCLFKFFRVLFHKTNVLVTWLRCLEASATT